MRTVVRALVATLTVLVSACSVDANKAIPCYDNSACPKDYPECSGATKDAPGTCGPAGSGGTPTAAASIKVVGAEGAPSGATVRGTVKIDVVARADAGIRKVTLGVDGSTTAPMDPVTVVPPLYTFTVDTTTLGAAHAAGQIVLDATITPADGSAAVTDKLTLNYDNTQASLSATGATIITLGDTTVLTPNFGGGSGAINGVAVTSGKPFVVRPSDNTTYQLTVTNAQGDVDHTAAPVSITVVAAPLITSFGPAAANVTIGGSTTLTAVFTGGTGTVDGGVGAVTSGSAASTGVISVNKTFNLTVTNAAGTAVHASATVSAATAVSAALTIGSGSASAITLTSGGSATLNPVCGASQTGAINQSVGAVASGSPVAVSPAATTTYTLTCTNAAGATATASVTVSVVAAPVINSFTTSAPTVTLGTTASLSFSFTGGTADVNGTVVTSGAPLVVTPTLGTVTYVLTVKNTATTQAVVSQSVAVTAIAAPAATSMSVTYNSGLNSAQLNPVFTGGTGFIDNGVGVVGSGEHIPVAPGTTTTYTLTVTNALNATSTTTASVAGVPSISGFTVNHPIIDSTSPSLSFTGTFLAPGGSATVTPNVGTVTTATPATLATSPTVDTTYTLTATNGVGVTATQSLSVQVVPNLSASDSLTAAAPTITISDGTTLAVNIASGETATFNGAPVVNGQQIGVTPSTTTTYSLIISNAAGHSQTKTATVTVVAQPAIVAFNAPLTVSSGQSFSLNFDFSGGTGGITGSAGTGVPITNIASGGSRTVTAPTTASTTNVTYTLTVTNAASTSVSASIVVQVVPAIGATSLIFTDAAGAANLTNAINVDPGATVYLKPTFSGGAGTLNGQVALSGVVVGPITVSQTTNPAFLLSVTSGSGANATATATATVNAKVYSFSVSPAFVTTGVATGLTFTSSHLGGGATGTAAGSISGTGIAALSIGSGAGATASQTVTLSAGSPPLSVPYTLTVNNSAGTAESPLATANVTVVAAPSGTSLTPGVATLTSGTSTTLTPVFTNDVGGSAVITSGSANGPIVATGVVTATAVTVAPTSTTQYFLVVTNRAGQVSNTVNNTITVVTPPATPTVTPGQAIVTVSATSRTASVVNHSGYTYAWTVAGVAQGTTTSSLTYTAPAAVGNFVITCEEIDGAGTHSQKGSAIVSAVAAPVQPTITAPFASVTASVATTATVPANAGMTYLWTITGGTAGGTNGTAGTTANGVNTFTFTPGASGTVALTCTESNAVPQAGTVSATKNLPIVAAPVAQTITSGSGGFITTGVTTTATVPAATSAGVHTWTLVGGTINSGTPGDTLNYTVSAPVGGSVVLNCVETSAAGATANCVTKTLTVVAAPVNTPVITTAFNSVTASTASTATVPASTGATYNWTITGGTGGSAAGTTALGVNTFSFTAGASGTVALTATETNQAGVSGTVSATKNLTIVAAPAVQAITAGSGGFVTTGATLTATVSAPASGQHTWTATGATINSGSPGDSINYTVTMGVGGTVTLNCVETNAGGVAANCTPKSLAVVAAPLTPVISTPFATVTASSTGNTASVTAPVAGSTYNWTITNGTITSATTGTSITYTAAASGSVVLGVKETNAASVQGSNGAATLATVATPGQGAISGAAANLTAFTVGATATCASTTASTFTWAIGGTSGASITSGQGTANLTYTAGGPGTVTLTCTGVNSAGTSGAVSATTTVTVVGAPAITRYFVDNSHVTQGDAFKLTLNTTNVPDNGTLSVVASGAAACVNLSIALASGVGTTSGVTAPAVAATTTCTYTVTVSNAAGATDQGAVQVVVEPNPVATISLTSATHIAPGGTATVSYTCDPKGGTKSITGGAALTCDGSAHPLSFTNLAQTTTYTISATNLAGKTVSNSVTETLDGSVTSWSAGATLAGSSSALVVLNGTTGINLFASYAGAGASGFDPASTLVSCTGTCGTLGATTVANGASVTLTNLTVNGTGTYTLAITPTAGGTAATANLTVKVVAAPVATSLLTPNATNSITIDQGNTTTLTPTFSFGGAGSATITNNVDGTRITGLTSTSPVTVSPNTTTTYTLSVASETGAAVTTTATVTVNPGPVISSFTETTGATTSGSSVNIVAGGTVTFNAVFSNGTAVISNDQNGTTINPTSGVTTGTVSPAVTTVYTLKVTSSTNPGLSVSRTLRVVLDPSISIFSVDHNNVTQGTTLTFSATYANGTGTINQTVGAISSGGTATGTALAPATTVYTLSVAPVAPSTITATATVSVTSVTPPGISLFTATPSLIAVNGSTQLAWTFTNGTGSINNGGPSGIAAGSSNTTINNIGSTTTYTLTVAPVTPTFGASVTATATATVSPGVWSTVNSSSTGSANFVRIGATVTKLDSGNFLIAGGNNAAGTPTNTALLCTPAGACTTPVGTPSTQVNMITARAFGSAVKLSNGTVLITGGYTAANKTTPTAKADLYDPVADGFNKSANAAADMQTTRAEHTCTVLSDSTVLCVGGVTTTGPVVLTKNADLYDATGLASNAASAALTTARSGHTATLLTNNNLLVVGGAATTTTEIFNGTNWTSVTGGAMTENKTQHTATLLTGGANVGKVLICGGLTGASLNTASAACALGTATGSAFSSVTALSVARSALAAVESPAAAGKVLLCGGLNSSSTPVATCDIEDTTASSGASTLLPTQAMIKARSSFGLIAPVTVSATASAVAGGGSTATSPTVNAEAYAP